MTSKSIMYGNQLLIADTLSRASKSESTLTTEEFEVHLLIQISKEKADERKRGGRNRIWREKWPKQSWEEGEIGRKSREEGEKEKLGVGRIELDGPG